MPTIGSPKSKSKRKQGGPSTSARTTRQKQQHQHQHQTSISDQYPTTVPYDSRSDSRSRSDSLPPGRLRRYSHPDDPHSEWNPHSSATPEGRLSNVNSADWYVPSGDEIHLRTDDGRLRTTGTDGSSESEYDHPNQTRYRADDFRVKATNAHDHVASIRVPMTPEMKSTISAIIRSGKLPFGNSPEQFMAVAAYELIQVCLRLEPIADSHAAVLETMNELNRNFRVVVDYDTTIRQSCRTIHDLIERGLKNQARVMVHDLVRTIERIRVRELKDKHRKRVMTEFAGLLKEAKPVSGRPVRAVHRSRNR